jgi:hypothetical protein
MDRRREPRIRTYETVQLTVLGAAGYTTPANAIQLSRHGMRLVTDHPLPMNAAIKIVCDDWMALGEVCYCRQDRSHYAVGLQLDQAIMGLKELEARSRDFSADESPILNEAEQSIA